jgi:hypothetical protein
MTLHVPATKPPTTTPTTTGMTSTSAAVDTLMCERSGNISAPRTTAQAMPTPEPQSRLFTGTFLYEMKIQTGDEQNEEIMKDADVF